jgi:hypothetical protein
MTTALLVLLVALLLTQREPYAAAPRRAAPRLTYAEAEAKARADAAEYTAMVARIRAGG